MDNPIDVVALTENQVRQIVSDEIREQLTELESRINEANRKALNEALKTVPTEDTVRQMIETRSNEIRTELKPRIEAVEASTLSVDLHLRQAEGRVSEAGRRMDNATDKFEGFITRAEGLLADLKAKTEINTGNIASINREIDIARTQADLDRTELTQTIDKLNDLRGDIHGDPDKPEMPSLFRVVALTNDNIKSLDTRLARYDAMVNFALRIWNTKVGKAVVISLLTAFGTDMVYQAAKIWQVLLGGR